MADSQHIPNNANFTETVKACIDTIDDIYKIGKSVQFRRADRVVIGLKNSLITLVKFMKNEYVRDFFDYRLNNFLKNTDFTTTNHNVKKLKHVFEQSTQNITNIGDFLLNNQKLFLRIARMKVDTSVRASRNIKRVIASTNNILQAVKSYKADKKLNIKMQQLTKQVEMISVFTDTVKSIINKAKELESFYTKQPIIIGCISLAVHTIATIVEVMNTVKFSWFKSKMFKFKVTGLKGMITELIELIKYAVNEFMKINGGYKDLFRLYVYTIVLRKLAEEFDLISLNFIAAFFRRKTIHQIIHGLVNNIAYAVDNMQGRNNAYQIFLNLYFCSIMLSNIAYNLENLGKKPKIWKLRMLSLRVILKGLVVALNLFQHKMQQNNINMPLLLKNLVSFLGIIIVMKVLIIQLKLLAILCFPLLLLWLPLKLGLWIVVKILSNIQKVVTGKFSNEAQEALTNLSKTIITLSLVGIALAILGAIMITKWKEILVSFAFLILIGAFIYATHQLIEILSKYLPKDLNEKIKQLTSLIKETAKIALLCVVLGFASMIAIANGLWIIGFLILLSALTWTVVFIAQKIIGRKKLDNYSENYAKLNGILFVLLQISLTCIILGVSATLAIIAEIPILIFMALLWSITVFIFGMSKMLAKMVKLNAFTNFLKLNALIFTLIGLANLLFIFSLVAILVGAYWVIHWLEMLIFFAGLIAIIIVITLMAWLLSKISWIQLGIGLLTMIGIIGTLYILGWMLWDISNMATEVMKNQKDFWSFLGIILAVIVVFGVVGLILGSIWLYLLIAIAGLALANLLIGAVFAMALMLKCIEKISLNVKKIKENIKAVLDASKMVSDAIFKTETDTTDKNANKKESWWESFVEGALSFLGAVGWVIKAILSSVFMIFSLISITMVLFLAGELWLLGKMELKKDLIENNVSTVVKSAQMVSDAINRKDVKDIKNPKKDGLWNSFLSVIDWLIPDTPIIDAIMSNIFLFHSIASIGMICFMAKMLQTINDIPSLDNITNKVDSIIKAAKKVNESVLNGDPSALESAKQAYQEDDGGFFSKIWEAGKAAVGSVVNSVVGPGSLYGLCKSVKFLSGILPAVFGIHLLAKYLTSINSVDTTKLNSADVNSQSILGMAVSLINSLNDKGLFESGPNAVMSKINMLTNFLRTVDSIASTGWGSGKLEAAEKYMQSVIKLTDSLSKLNAKNLKAVNPYIVSIGSVIEDIASTGLTGNKNKQTGHMIDKYSQLFKSITEAKIDKNDVDFLEKSKDLITEISNIDESKLKKATSMFDAMSVFAKNITSDFDKLAELLNSKIVPLLEELKNSLNGTNIPELNYQPIPITTNNNWNSQQTATPTVPGPIASSNTIDNERYEEEMSERKLQAENIQLMLDKIYNLLSGNTGQLVQVKVK